MQINFFCSDFEISKCANIWKKKIPRPRRCILSTGTWRAIFFRLWAIWSNWQLITYYLFFWPFCSRILENKQMKRLGLEGYITWIYSFFFLYLFNACWHNLGHIEEVLSRQIKCCHTMVIGDHKHLILPSHSILTPGQSVTWG